MRSTSAALIALAAACPATLLASCSRGPHADAAPADSAATATPAPPASAAETPAPPSRAPEPVAKRAPIDFVPIEVGRAKLPRLEREPSLAKHQQRLHDHFAGKPGPWELQTLALPAGRRALLVSAEAVDKNPIVLVVEADQSLVWSKEHVIGGIAPPVTQLTMAEGPPGGVALFVYDAPTGIVAARMWDAEGGLLVDFQLFTVDACDALAALRWPGRGWIAVASFGGSSRAQLLRDDGSLAWGKNGVALGTESRPKEPASLVLDTDDSFLLVQAGPGTPTPADVVASRYDERAGALWASPLDLGAASRLGAGDHASATREKDGLVRIAIRKGQASAPSRTIDLDSDGKVVVR